jgi:hypothetical protein
MPWYLKKSKKYPCWSKIIYKQYRQRLLPDPATTSTQTEPFPPGLQFGPELTTNSNLNKNIHTVQNKHNNNPSISDMIAGKGA